jgi:hypothetical protein
MQMFVVAEEGDDGSGAPPRGDLDSGVAAAGAPTADPDADNPPTRLPASESKVRSLTRGEAGDGIWIKIYGRNFSYRTLCLAMRL